MTNNEFIEAIASYVAKYSKVYGILVNSPIIAQAILESGWGKSKLSSKYYNYFGLKCGSKWTGRSVNLSTKEEYKAGTTTNIKANFRVYSSMEDGIKGYFEFINTSRYENLKGITDPKKYLETIKADGYATSSTYVSSNYKIINQYGLTKYDRINTTEEENKTATVKSGKWNIRSGSNIKYSSIAVVNGGTKLIVLDDCGNGWYQVKNGNTTGYISGKALE